MFYHLQLCTDKPDIVNLQFIRHIILITSQIFFFGISLDMISYFWITVHAHVRTDQLLSMMGNTICYLSEIVLKLYNGVLYIFFSLYQKILNLSIKRYTNK